MPVEPRPSKGDAWSRVQLARHEKRPTGSDLVEVFEPLRRGGCDNTVITGLARFGLRPAMVIAQNRRADHGRTTPAGYERARRAIAFADRFGMPIVTLIDTPGADLSDESERGGIAKEISATFLRLLAARKPTIGIVVGEGGSGGALALAACDRLFMLENSIFSVIGPEAAAAILRQKDVSSLAGDLKLTAHDMLKLGIADRVLPEPENGAHLDPEATRTIVNDAIGSALDTLSSPSKHRFERWRVHR
jgi:acetyl-CoA carboxylase carboxyl transferase subunit alpha